MPTPAAAKMPTPAAAEGEEAVDGANAGGEGLCDAGAVERAGGRGDHCRFVRGIDRAFAVDGVAEGVEDAAADSGAGGNGGGSARRRNERLDGDGFEAAEGEEHDVLAVESTTSASSGFRPARSILQISPMRTSGMAAR